MEKQDTHGKWQSGHQKSGKEPSWILMLVLTVSLMVLGYFQMASEMVFAAIIIGVAGIVLSVQMKFVLDTRILQLQAHMWSERNPQIMLQGIKKLRIYYLWNARLLEENEGIAYILYGEYGKAAKIWEHRRAVRSNEKIAFEASWYLLWMSMLRFHRKEAAENIERWKGFPATLKMNEPFKTPMVEIFHRVIRVLSGRGQLVIIIVGIVILRRNAWRWYIVMNHFTKTSDCQYFHKKLIPLSQQTINPMIRMGALNNLLWLDSFYGNSENVKALSLFLLRKENGMVEMADAYTALIQELILEGDFRVAQQYWEEAIRFSGVMDKKENIAHQMLNLYGHILKEQYEEGIVLLEQMPEALQFWRDNANETIFWNWYLHYHAGKAEAAVYREKLEKAPSMHQGYLKMLERNPA